MTQNTEDLDSKDLEPFERLSNDIKDKFNTINKIMKNMETEIGGMKTEMDTRFDTIDKDMNDRFGEIAKRQDKTDLKLRRLDIQSAYGNSAKVPVRSRMVAGAGIDDIEILPDYEDY